MAASSSATSSVVELGTAAELDTATSAYSDDGSAHFSWPAAEQTKSSLTGDDQLQKLCNRYRIPKEYMPVFAGDMAACAAPPEGFNAACVYADALDAGMRLPLPDLHVAVLRHYGLAPSQLKPNSWRYMNAFVLLCEDAGVEPSLSVFRHLFSICADSSGWYHFKPSSFSAAAGSSRRVVLFAAGKMPSYPGWKSRFFFLKSPATTPWPCAVKWGKPSRAAVRKPVATTAIIGKLLERAGSSGIDLMKFLSERRQRVGCLQASLSPPPTRKRMSPAVEGMATPPGFSHKKCSGGGGESSSTRALVLVGGTTGQLQSEKEAMAEVGGTELVPRAGEGEVALLMAGDEEMRIVAGAEHSADVAQLEEALAAAEAQHATDVARLKDELEKANAARAAEVGRLTAELDKARCGASRPRNSDSHRN